MKKKWFPSLSPPSSMPTRQRVLLIANTSWYLFNFRFRLAQVLWNEGYEPIFVAPRDRYSEFLENSEFRYIEFSLHRSRLNPWREWNSINELRKIYRQERPALAHHFTLKCVIYGSIAARLEGIPLVVNSITGLGHLFTSSRPLARALRICVRFGYRYLHSKNSTRTIFQNTDDAEDFLGKRECRRGKHWEIPTSGVNLGHFSPANGSRGTQEFPLVLFAARLLREKGLLEFIDAVRILRSRKIKARFVLGGSLDPGNPSSVSAEQIKHWVAELNLEAPGHIEDMKEALASANIFVLPSYREGGSKTILEASAMGVPVITTNAPGCRNLVENGVTGLIVPPKNSAALAEAIECLVKNPKLCVQMGEAGRKKIQESFGDQHIAERTLEVYLGKAPASEASLAMESTGGRAR